MKVYKFGGASVKDANSIKNVGEIVKFYHDCPILIIVSAMGKTTNALEHLTQLTVHNDKDYLICFEEIKSYHMQIIGALFPDLNDPIYIDIHNCFTELEWALEDSKDRNYAFRYDQIVCYGEIISTIIVNRFLNAIGIPSHWLDARDYIKTNESFQEGNVLWDKTIEQMQGLAQKVELGDQQYPIFVTQGFIGGTDDNYTTTLGREGSDYSAAIFAFGLNASAVTIWKDVPGVLNADPKWFDATELLPRLSYADAIELSYYGATVIHPKTIKPLQNKNIPLFVRSFIHFTQPGTKISNDIANVSMPCFIFKMKQALISFVPKDFSFVAEENLSNIFKVCFEIGIKINAMENSAIKFSICCDYNQEKIDLLRLRLAAQYTLLYNAPLEFITIRYYNQETIDRVTLGKEVLLEVRSRLTNQLVVRDL